MILSIGEYVKAECLPYARQILLDWNIVFAGCAVYLSFVNPGLPAEVTMQRFTETALWFGAVSFGFSTTVYTLALTLPQPGVIRLLSLDKPPGEKKDSYSKLLFVFSWTALAQLLLVFVALTALFSTDINAAVRSAHEGTFFEILSIVTIFTLAYSLLQLVSALLALTQLGRIISRETRDASLREREQAAFDLVGKQD
jgi:hypothetical protein